MEYKRLGNYIREAKAGSTSRGTPLPSPGTMSG